MHPTELQNVKNCCRLLVSIAALLLLPACSINVKKEGNGQDKQVDIKTLLGGIHVSKDADVAETGLALYPGAHLKRKDSGDDKSANVNISGFGYGVRVIAMEYETDDSPAKLVAFYKDQLKKYGNVLECRTSSHVDVNMKMSASDKESHELTCDSTHGNNIELKVGSKDNQHIVAVRSSGSGSTFAVVYMRAWDGKDTI